MCYQKHSCMTICICYSPFMLSVNMRISVRRYKCLIVNMRISKNLGLVNTHIYWANFAHFGYGSMSPILAVFGYLRHTRKSIVYP